jgi:hypothetical protein
MKTMRLAIGTGALACVVILTGCGSDNEAPSDAPSDTPSSTSPSASGGPGGFDTAQIQLIRDCLKAAGLDDVFPTGAPSGRPTGSPPGTFDPNNPPSGFPTDGTDPAGGGLTALGDPAVQQALEACGIDLPQRPSAR